MSVKLKDTIDGRSANADVSTKLGTATVGGASTPIYLNQGVATAGAALGTAAYKAVGDFATASHTHDDRYYTESETNTKLNAKLGAKTANSYVGMTKPDGTDLEWIRTTSSGLIPYASGGSSSSLGTSGWRFKNIYGVNGNFSGTLVLSKTQDLSGTANNSPALIVGGTADEQHIEIDGNKIHSKANGTTAGNLYINDSGGAVYVNSKKVSVEGHTHNYAGSNAAGGVANSAYKMAYSNTLTGSFNFNNVGAGVYKVFNATMSVANNSPRHQVNNELAYAYGTLVVYDDGSGNVVQQYFTHNQGKQYVRVKYDNDSGNTWSEWNQLYGTYERFDGSSLYPDVHAWRFGNVCTVIINGPVGISWTEWSDTLLMTLPMGMKPLYEINQPLGASNEMNHHNAALQIKTNGEVRAKCFGGYNPGYTSSNSLYTCVTFVTTA